MFIYYLQKKCKFTFLQQKRQLLYRNLSTLFFFLQCNVLQFIAAIVASFST